jgi:hypothetical protein
LWKSRFCVLSLMNNHSQSQSYHIMNLSDPIVQMLSAGICGGCRGYGRGGQSS